jgi:enamine deaminase RidA (YjgF/YER057c/UK114 family)
MKKTLMLMILSGVLLGNAHAADDLLPEQKLATLGLALPASPAVVANYVPAVRSGSLVFLAGQIARGADGKVIVGRVGQDFTEAQGAEAAQTCALQLLAALKAEIGDLARVKRIVRVGGFVNCTSDFTAQSKVINGASDLCVAVFGERGRHARAAVGVAALPGGAPVEVELIAEVMD